jgi:hypothetical protein
MLSEMASYINLLKDSLSFLRNEFKRAKKKMEKKGF